MTDKAKNAAQPKTDQPSNTTKSAIEPLRLVFKKVHANSTNNVPWIDVWATVLEVDKSDAAMYGILGMVSQSIKTAILQLEHTPNYAPNLKSLSVSILTNCGEYLKPIKLHESATANRGHFGPEKMDMLLVAAEALERRYQEPNLSGSDKKDMLDLIDAMEKLLGSGQLDPLLTKMLEPHIKMMRWALQNYDLVGVDGLVQSCIDASLALRRVDTDADADAPINEFKSKFGSFWKYVDKMDKLVRVIEGGFRIAGKGVELIDKLPD